jgi:hypothetical protein
MRDNVNATSEPWPLRMYQMLVQVCVHCALVYSTPALTPPPLAPESSLPLSKGLRVQGLVRKTRLPPPAAFLTVPISWVSVLPCPAPKEVRFMRQDQTNPFFSTHHGAR